MSNLRDRIFNMAAEARIAAKAEGWREHPADRDVFVRGQRRLRLTELDPRRWCFGAAHVCAVCRKAIEHESPCTDCWRGGGD